MLLYNADTVTEKKLKKAIFTLNIGNYAPEITALTYPFIKIYADKIDAEFIQITKRRFPDFPFMYEKLQIFELGRDNEWNIYVDSDTLLHPDLFDITEVLPIDTVLTYGADFANTRYKYDSYFRRDGRHIGTGDFFMVASHLCHEIWEPLSDITLEEAASRIHIIHKEEIIKHKPGYGIDEFVTSRNLAKYHFKFKTFPELLTEINRSQDEFFYHNHLATEKEKVELIKKTISDWKY